METQTSPWYCGGGLAIAALLLTTSSDGQTTKTVTAQNRAEVSVQLR
jgi:hypothetical protein